MGLLFILLLFGVILSAYSEQCPPQEEMNPCVCDNVHSGQINVKCFSHFSDDKVTVDDLRKSFKSLQGKTVFVMVLFDNTLGTIPSDLFKNIRLKHLHIEDSRLESLADGDKPIFAGLEDSLEGLRIKNSLGKNTDLSKLSLGHLEKLKEITLHDNSIKTLSNSWFGDGPASLKNVDLVSNNIEEIGDRVFANLPSLKRVTLYRNKIHSLKRGMFPKPALHLKELYFIENPIESLPEDMFSDMPALRFLSVEVAGIKRLDEETWEPIWEQLNYLNLLGNPLKCDSSMEWLLGLRIPGAVFGLCEDAEKSKVVHIIDFINENKKMYS